MRTPLWRAMLNFLFIAVVQQPAVGQTTPKAERLCPNQISLTTTDFRYKIPLPQMARIELRQCEPGSSEVIQIVAWRSGGTSPDLIIETGDFGLVQSVSRANIFFFETGGATRDHIFVIAYKNGLPSLALRKATKGTATVTVTSSSLDLSVEGICAGDKPSITESYHFDLVAGDLRYK